MLNSIEKSFDDSDFELDEVYRSSKWKSIAERSNIVAGDAFYGVYYGLASHSIHGSWQDILLNNLKKTENGYKINLDWHSIKPQIIDGPIGINLDIIALLNKENKDLLSNKEIVIKVEELHVYHKLLMETREKFLSKNS